MFGLGSKRINMLRGVRDGRAHRYLALRGAARERRWRGFPRDPESFRYCSFVSIPSEYH